MSGRAVASVGTSLAPTPGAAVIVALVALLGASIIVASGVGAVEVPLSTMLEVVLGDGVASDSQAAGVWLHIRLPRVLLGVLVGASLGCAGALLQGLFRNALADAGVIGLSTGGALGAATATLIASRLASPLVGVLAGLYLPAAAFAGALVAAIVLERMAAREGAGIARLLLAGVAINALAGAGIGLLVTVADDAELRTITFWTLGSLGGATWPLVLAVAPFAMVPLLMLPRLARGLDLLLLGERAAGHLGVDVARLQRKVVILTSAMVGASVAATGVIGFVGLLVPHALRLVIGPGHRLLLPASALGGASLIVLADLLARTVVVPSELPIGLITALVGAPMFLWLIDRRRAAEVRA